MFPNANDRFWLQLRLRRWFHNNRHDLYLCTVAALAWGLYMLCLLRVLS